MFALSRRNAPWDQHPTVVIEEGDTPSSASTLAGSAQFSFVRTFASEHEAHTEALEWAMIWASDAGKTIAINTVSTDRMEWITPLPTY